MSKICWVKAAGILGGLGGARRGGVVGVGMSIYCSLGGFGVQVFQNAWWTVNVRADERGLILTGQFSHVGTLNIKHSAPCWLHTAHGPLSSFCRPARCPTYCEWANVGRHGISRKYARGAAARVMKCTQSLTRIDNKTQSSAEQLWPCSTARVASIIVQFRRVSAHRVLTKALFSRKPSLFSVHMENTYGLDCELIS